MNRYLHKSQVNVGDRILFDNKTGFIKDMIRSKFIGEVISVDLEGDLIEVAFKINGIVEPVIQSIPYFLCQ